MYKEVYHNPYNRAKEAFLKRTLAGNKIELDDLLRWSDSDLENWFETGFGTDALNLFFGSRQPFKEIGREYDLTRLEEVRAEWEHGDVIVEHMKPARNALKNHVLHRGRVVLLEDIPKFADEVADVRSIISGLDYIGIYQRLET